VGTFERLLHRPLGFSHQNVLVLQVESREPQAPQIWAQAVDQVRHTPGVDAAAFAGWPPLTGNRWRGSVRVAGRPLEANAPFFISVSAGYFQTMRIETVHGRDFRTNDAPPRLDRQQQPVAGFGIVNQAFARVYFDGQTPVGRRVSVRQNKDSWAPMEIVGLVRDAAYHSIREPMHPTVYVPVEARNNAAVIVRTATEPLALAATLRREVSRAQPDFRVRAVEPLTGVVREHMIRERLLAALSAFFALVAVLLTGIGLYGMLNYAVVGQRREIGIRMALGARPADVLRLVVRQGMLPVVVGLGLGLAGALGATRLMRSLLYGVGAGDPVTFVAIALVLTGVALLASVIPARRAARVDPMVALRTE
jgi:predicted permease